MEQAGMGVGIGDLRLDGSPHIVKTHFAADTPAVNVNNGKGDFSDVTLPSGFAVDTPYVCWMWVSPIWITGVRTSSG
jgi:hypothetical protein